MIVSSDCFGVSSLVVVSVVGMCLVHIVITIIVYIIEVPVV